MKAFALAVGLSLIASISSAQAPYAGMQTRPIKALSEKDVASLRAGSGAGMALAAELNGYPGPIHVLELAQQLNLTIAQKTQVEQLFNSMKAEAMPLGAQLIEQETALDQQFANRSVTPDSLKQSMTKIGAIQANLRFTHLKYHLQTAQLLSPEQMKEYAGLRGYTDQPEGQHHHHH